MGTSDMGSASAAATARRLLTELGPDVAEGLLRRCVCKKAHRLHGVSFIIIIFY